MTAAPPLQPPHRILLGPGPSAVHPRVLRAMSMPLVGHLDPAFSRIMEETKRLLQRCLSDQQRTDDPDLRHG